MKRTTSRLLPRLLLTPAVATLFLWMIVPLGMTIYFSLIRYNLLQPDVTGFAGLENFAYFVTDPLVHHLGDEHRAAAGQRDSHHRAAGGADRPADQ
jgi:ABC-type sugar transport system permease subunit